MNPETNIVKNADAKNKKPKEKKVIFLLNFVLLAILVFLFGNNQMTINNINKELGIKNDIVGDIEKTLNGNVETTSKISSDGKTLSGNLTQDSINLVISEGVPDIYGEEMNVSFSEVQRSMNTMKQYDPTYGNNKINMDGENLKRYINIGSKISCEYCCGAKSIINKDGKAACGCAHSWAMRGLAAYLIKNHGSEYSDDEILRELSRWKGLYFPKQMIQKMAEQLQSGKYTPDIASLIMKKDLPKYGGTGEKAPLPSEIENLPGMVGGC